MEVVLVKAIALLVSGASLYAPFKMIAAIAKVIGQFGEDKEGKKEAFNKILMMQWGGIIIFAGCYIVTVGLILNFLGLINICALYICLLFAALVISFGIFIPYNSIKKVYKDN